MLESYIDLSIALGKQEIEGVIECELDLLLSGKEFRETTWVIEVLNYVRLASRQLEAWKTLTRDICAPKLTRFDENFAWTYEAERRLCYL